MKGKIIILLLAALLLTGCGQAAPAVPAGHFEIRWEQTQIALDAPAGPVLAALGTPYGYAERSGRGGLEKTYRFPGMDLHTYPGADGERILGVLINGGSMKTAEGIAIGASARQVQECYGLDTLPTGSCTLRRSSETLTLTIRNSVVTEIRYSMV